ncbi:MAG: signal recognition particle-docking protein FtsY [Ignisphaera sp.]|uniref:Signal recognition particle receptor FtsY n=1 Tax=Ignisphaera aggregans TaxID=334771 RepID=A0A7J3N0L0_9CREN
MFSKLKEALTSFTKRISETLKYRELSSEEVEKFCNNFLLELVEADVAFDVAQEITESIKSKLREIKVPRGRNTEEVILDVTRDSIREMLNRGLSRNFLEIIKDTLSISKPVKIVFVGVNGVGKTTTIAKVAYMAMKNSLRPVIVAADTFRAGAQEQLKKHSANLNIPFIGGKYGSDPASVAFDGVIYAAKNGYDIVLIDTAGRMHVDVDLMNELRKIVKVVNPHLKILVVDALTGNDAIEQVKFFDKAVGIDGVILTKVDADAKGGAALSIILGIGRPIFFIGVGQGYEDLELYDPNTILSRIL